MQNAQILIKSTACI